VALKIQAHGQVINLQMWMMMASPNITTGGAAGHEEPLALLRWDTRQRQFFERIDGHRGNVTPIAQGAWRASTLLTHLLKWQVMLVLVLKKPQGHGIEGFIIGFGAVDEVQQVL
jgi:hypothetical protein